MPISGAWRPGPILRLCVASIRERRGLAWLRPAPIAAAGFGRSRFPDWVVPVRELGDPPRQLPDHSRGDARRLAGGATRVLSPVRWNAQILGKNLAGAIIRNKVKIDRLPFLQLLQSGAVDGADVDV